MGLRKYVISMTDSERCTLNLSFTAPRGNHSHMPFDNGICSDDVHN